MKKEGNSLIEISSISTLDISLKKRKKRPHEKTRSSFADFSPTFIIVFIRMQQLIEVIRENIEDNLSKKSF